MGIGLINLAIIFLRLSSGYTTGNIGSVTSYKLQSGIFLVLLILLALFISNAKKNHYEEATKKEKNKFFIIGLLAITQYMVMVIFEMYKFWAI